MSKSYVVTFSKYFSSIIKSSPDGRPLNLSMCADSSTNTKLNTKSKNIYKYINEMVEEEEEMKEDEEEDHHHQQTRIPKKMQARIQRE